MPTTTVRVTPETRAILQEMARESKQSMQWLVARAVERYRRQLVLEQANAAYAALRAQPDAWAEEQEERRAWDAALADDLQGDE